MLRRFSSTDRCLARHRKKARTAFGDPESTGISPRAAKTVGLEHRPTRKRARAAGPHSKSQPAIFAPRPIGPKTLNSRASTPLFAIRFRSAFIRLIARLPGFAAWSRMERCSPIYATSQIVSPFDGTISCIFEIVGAFVGFDCFDQRADMPPCLVDGPFLRMTHPVLYPREGLFDRVDVRQIGWQEPDACACGFDRASDGGRLVAGEIVHNHPSWRDKPIRWCDGAGTTSPRMTRPLQSVQPLLGCSRRSTRRRQHAHEDRLISVRLSDAGPHPASINEAEQN